MQRKPCDITSCMLLHWRIAVKPYAAGLHQIHEVASEHLQVRSWPVDTESANTLAGSSGPCAGSDAVSVCRGVGDLVLVYKRVTGEHIANYRSALAPAEDVLDKADP